MQSNNKKTIHKVSIFANNKKAESSQLVSDIQNFLTSRDVAYDTYLTFDAYDIKKVDKETSLAIILGGDGTVLSCARLLHAYGIPMLAVNLGTFGFITEIAKAEWESAYLEYEKGVAAVSRRLMIRVSVQRKEKRVFQSHGLNEMTISSSGLSKMISLHLYINETLASFFRSDGVIVATPTGSTGYSLAAGGPILDVNLDALIINPICPFTLSNRPLVVNGEDIIKVIVPKGQKTDLALSVDGQVLFLLEEDDEIVIEKSRSKALLIESTKRNYYEVIRDKLNWSGGLHA
ncbi:MAG: NAD(+)/NADH kinase [Spirochaetia bacterium]|nr:NAD(+)/NADH kinase [Spirochaetia bacterium]